MENMTYEQAYAKLEEYTERLESGELTLDDSLQVFEKAVALSRYCGVKLDGANKQMLVRGEGLNGEMEEKVFNPEEYRG